MNNTAIQNTADKFYEIFKGSSEFCAVLDSDFKVIKSSDERLFAIGECMAEHFGEKVYVPLEKLTCVRIYKRDRAYCGRLYPFEGIIVCEMFGSTDIFRLAAAADTAERVLPMFSITEANTAAMWETLDRLAKDCLQSESSKTPALISQLQSRLAGISSVNRNLYEYCGMCLSEQQTSRIDAGALCRHLVDRCNAALSKCGRRIELLTESDCMHIMADSRRAAAALVNALQNALLYSPRECVPVMTVYTIEQGGRRYVEISVVNDNIMFTREDFSSGIDVNYNHQRAGFGIPIIKLFAECCHGRVSITDENGKKRVRLTLPCAPEGCTIEVRLENSGITGYKTGVPDFLDICMREVAEVFGDTDWNTPMK